MSRTSLPLFLSTSPPTLLLPYSSHTLPSHSSSLPLLPYSSLPLFLSTSYPILLLSLSLPLYFSSHTPPPSRFSSLPLLSRPSSLPLFLSTLPPTPLLPLLRLVPEGVCFSSPSVLKLAKRSSAKGQTISVASAATTINDQDYKRFISSWLGRRFKLSLDFLWDLRS